MQPDTEDTTSKSASLRPYCRTISTRYSSEVWATNGTIAFSVVSFELDNRARIEVGEKESVDASTSHYEQTKTCFTFNCYNLSSLAKISSSTTLPLIGTIHTHYQPSAYLRALAYATTYLNPSHISRLFSKRLPTHVEAVLADQA
jgi:hypothetical protein